MSWRHPHVYRGVTMKSETEVLWATYFDALGLLWDYEPVTFGRTKRYTPDFLLQGQTFIEVKSRPTVGWNANLLRCRAGLIVVIGAPTADPNVLMQCPGDFGLQPAPDWPTAYAAVTARRRTG